jgi:hypothetical protein
VLGQETFLGSIDEYIQCLEQRSAPWGQEERSHPVSSEVSNGRTVTVRREIVPDKNRPTANLSCLSLSSTGYSGTSPFGYEGHNDFLHIFECCSGIGEVRRRKCVRLQTGACRGEQSMAPITKVIATRSIGLVCHTCSSSPEKRKKFPGKLVVSTILVREGPTTIIEDDNCGLYSKLVGIINIRYQGHADFAREVTKSHDDRCLTTHPNEIYSISRGHVTAKFHGQWCIGALLQCVAERLTEVCLCVGTPISGQDLTSTTPSLSPKYP